MFNGFYEGKRVLVTGHTGFKGAWLSLWLKELGAVVWGAGLPSPTRPNLHDIFQPYSFAAEIQCDVRLYEQVEFAVMESKPDLIFHLAAQPLVRRSYVAPLETLSTNALGTAHVLEAVRRTEQRCTTVVVTTDKCYENKHWDHAYRECDPLGGHDVYSSSKAAAELIVQSWRKSFFEPNAKLGPVATARAGNVIGGGDYAEDRIVPDCVRALLDHRVIQVRNPEATRPWQHVLDCLSGYLWLGACLTGNGGKSATGEAYNFGPGVQANLPVSHLVETILHLWPGRWEKTPTVESAHEAGKLNLAIDKAAAQLSWLPTWNFREAIEHTVAWYHQRHVAENRDMLAYSTAQIHLFTSSARNKEIAWSSTNPK